MFDIFLTLLGGVGETLRITGASLAIGLIGGVPIVTMRRSKSAVLRMLGIAIIEFTRSIPPVVWLFLIFYGLGSGVLKLSPFQAAVIGLGLIASTYMAEIYRAGLDAVGNGQMSAAEALGMPLGRTYFHVIVPQALVVVIAPTITFSISLLKDSALASILGAIDVTYLAFQETQVTLQGLSIFMIAGAIYLALSLPIAAFGKLLDQLVSRRLT